MDVIKIGVIVNTHGLKGTFKIKSFTDFVDERYQKGNTLYISFKNELLPVTVKEVRTVKGLEYVDFDEYNHINQIEQFKGSELFIDSNMIHPLDENEFYFGELIGMTVVGTEVIGECIDVMELPQGQLLVVKRTGKKNALIPFQKEFVSKVDKQKQIISVIEMEGLL